MSTHRGMQGMDTEEARHQGQRMGAQAGQVAGVVASIGAVVQALNWEGADKRAFESDWSGNFAPAANTAAESLSEQGRALCVQADRQDAASA
jgi:uncharacterized protein YukE